MKLTAARLSTTFLLAFIAHSCSGQAPVPLPITGNLGNLAGTPEPNAYVSVLLENCSGGAPQITGFTNIVPGSYNFVADTDGNINGTVWPNDQITCAGTTGATIYALSVYDPNNSQIGQTQCFQVIHSQVNWNINTQSTVACGTTPPNPTNGTFGNLNSTGFFQGVNGSFSGNLSVGSISSGALTGYLALTGGALTGATTNTSTINGIWAVNCLGVEDTAQFNAVATAAAGVAGANNIQTITVSGNCVVSGQVNLPSYVHWQGSGGTVTIPIQAGSCHYTFLATNADDVEFDGFTIVVTNSPGGDLACYNAIQWIDNSVDTTAHSHVYIRDNTVINSVWGIYVQYAHGSGSLTNVDISGNTVESPAGSYTNGDGIHVDGKVNTLTITRNRISYRNDAAIGITSNGAAYPQSGALVADNILIEDRVGMDCSGCTNTEWSHNYVRSTLVPSLGSCPNPSYRQIYFASTFPTGVIAHDNYLNSADASSICSGVPLATANLDPAGATNWPAQGNAFKNNVIDGPTPPFYARGSGFTVEGNTFVTGGQFTLDYDPGEGNNTQNVVIGKNTWLHSGSILMGAGCANYSNVQVQPQDGIVTYTNLPCLGTQTFSTPGDLNIASGNIVSTGTGFTIVLPGAGTATDFLVRDPSHTTNHLIVDSTGNLNIPIGWIATAQYVKVGGGATGGMRNAAGATVIPGAVDVPHGSSSTHIQMSDGSGTPGNCPEFAADGALTDSGAACGGGGGGAGVSSIDTLTGAFTFGGAGVSHVGNAYTFSGTGSGVSSINTVSGAFTFTGAGVSCTTTTCTFSGTGSGVTSVALTTPSWLTVAGSPITTSGTLAVTGTSEAANLFLASPNGSAGAMTPRAVVAADLPNLPESQITNLTTDLAAKALAATTVNGHALTSNVTVSASDITTGTLPAAQIPAQYKIKPCTVGMGDGLNAIPAGTYPIKFQCFNDYGVTYTITQFQCASDNSGSSTGNAANNSGTGLLTGAVTATPSWASGTQSATTTLASGTWVNWTIVSDGTSKQIQCRMKGTY